MPDRALVELLESTANRSVAAVESLQREVERLRDELVADRRRDDQRFAALDDRLEALDRRIGRVDARCGALVLEEDGPDGDTVITARPAQVGLDWRFIVGAILTLVTTGVVPILVAHAT